MLIRTVHILWRFLSIHSFMYMDLSILCICLFWSILHIHKCMCAYMYAYKHAYTSNKHEHLHFITTVTVTWHCSDLAWSRIEKFLAAVFAPRKILTFSWQILNVSINLTLSVVPGEIWQTSLCFASWTILQVSKPPLCLHCFTLLFQEVVVK